MLPIILLLILLTLFAIEFWVYEKEIDRHIKRADEGWQHAENEHQRAVLLECKCNKLIGEKANIQSWLDAQQKENLRIRCEFHNAISGKDSMLAQAKKLSSDLIAEVDSLRARLKKAHR